MVDKLKKKKDSAQSKNNCVALSTLDFSQPTLDMKLKVVKHKL
jgi:hypothetical protein